MTTRAYDIAVGTVVDTSGFVTPSDLNNYALTTDLAGYATTSDLATKLDGNSTLNPANLDSNGTIPSQLLAGVGGGDNTPYFYAHRDGNQTGLSGNAWNTIIFNNETVDSEGSYNTSTGKFNPQTAGYYQVNVSVTALPSSNITETNLGLFKNTAIDPEYASKLKLSTTVMNQRTATISGLVYLNGTSDYIWTKIYMTGSGQVFGNKQYTSFAAYKIAS